MSKIKVMEIKALRRAEYFAPSCKEVSLQTESILCQSVTAQTTEQLNEENGEW